MDELEEVERLLSEVPWELEVPTCQEADDCWNTEYGCVEVKNITLKPEYMKIQRKRVEGSQQRIENGMVYFTLFSLMQIINVRTFVQRLTDWVDDIAFNRPENGWSELYTKMVRQKVATYDYMTDLDSVYKDKEGSYVYGLVKNKGNNIRNTYVFFVEVELLDQTVESFCWSFVLKTKPVGKPRAHGL